MSDAIQPAAPVALVPASDWIAKRDSLIAKLQTFDKIVDDADYRAAGALDTEAKKAISELSKMRLNVTRQLDAVKKDIMNQEKELVNGLVAEQTRVNKLLTDYYAALCRKREEEERRIAEQQRREAEAAAAAATPVNPFDFAATPETAAPVPVPATQVPRTDTNRGSKTFNFRIVDATQVPREFCTPDERLVRAYVQQQKTLTGGDESLVKQVPGILIFAEYKVSAR